MPQDIKSKYDIILEAKARLEDEVDSLQSKVDLLGEASLISANYGSGCGGKKWWLGCCFIVIIFLSR